MITGLVRPSAGVGATPLFIVSPPSQTVDLSSGSVQLQVQAQNVVDAASFQFVLRYDSGVLSSPTVTVGPFLGSSGRQVQCPASIVDGPNNGPGTVEFGCVTPGQGAGVSGSGVLATVSFRLAGGSDTAIDLSKDTLSTALAVPLCPGVSTDWCPAQGGAVHVKGGNAAGNRGLAPTPTPVEVGNASSNGTPGPTGQLPNSVSGDGAQSTGTSGTGGAPPSGSSQDPSAQAGTSPGTSAGSAAAAHGSGVGRFGYGPQPSHRNTNTAIAASEVLGLLGGIFVAAAIVMRRRLHLRA
jgi:hypothetical protein